MNGPTRPVLRWHGGKWLLAPWIISHFPPHRVYVEPFGGAASVLMRKARSQAECVNDLDGRLVNVFRVLRDPVKAAELHRRIRLTPFARAEFEWSYCEATDAIDDAHKMIVLSFMGHGSGSASRSCRTGFRAKVTGSGRAFPSNAWARWHNSIPEFTERLAGVVLEQRAAGEVMRRLDAPATLFYVDPPYLPETRTLISGGRASSHGYRHELDRGGHAALLEQMRTLTGMVVLSGYPADLYDDALTGWTRVEREALADGARARTEVLWINPACHAALERERAGGPLFEGAA